MARCASADQSLVQRQEDGFPIKVLPTRQILWGCIKVGSFYIRKFTVKNLADEVICVEVRTSREEFRFRLTGPIQLVNIETGLRLILLPLVTYTFSAYFFPTANHPYYGRLTFTLVDPRKKLTEISLYGHGGHQDITFHHKAIVRGPASDACLMPLGFLRKSSPIVQRITCRNEGDVSGFVYAMFEYNRQIPFPIYLDVYPKKFVVKPHGSANFFIQYAPIRPEYEHFLEHSVSKQDVFALGELKLYAEAEPVRQLLKSLYGSEADNPAKVPSFVKEIIGQFKCEDEGLKGTDGLQADVNTMQQLLGQLNLQQMVLTIKCENH